MEILIAYQNDPNFRLDYALNLALLHDTLEDTSATFEDLAEKFGEEIAEGVDALTKNQKLEKVSRMPDSLNRIKALPKEVAAVKLADRITNLQEPPQFWDRAKKEEYHQEATRIMQFLKGTNAYLETRLYEKLAQYRHYF